MLEFSEKDWDDVMNVNLRSLFFLSQEVARQMQKQGRGGKIINIASMLVPGRHSGPVVHGKQKRGGRPDKAHGQRAGGLRHPGERYCAGVHGHRQHRGSPEGSCEEPRDPLPEFPPEGGEHPMT